MPDAPQPDAPRFQLSLVQVIAAALASITSALILSYFGVAGTVIGTAVGSVVSTIGVAVYSHTMRRARRGVSRVAQHHQSVAERQDRSATPAAEPRQRSAAWNRHSSGVSPGHQARPAAKSPANRVGASAAGRQDRSAIPATEVRSRSAAWNQRSSATPRGPGRPAPRSAPNPLVAWFHGLPLWGKYGVLAGGIFLAVVLSIATFEVATGHELSNIWGRGTSSGGPNGGCAVGQCGTATPAPPATAPPTTGPSSQPTTGPTPAPTAVPTTRPTTAPTVVPTTLPSTQASPQAKVSPRASPGAGGAG